MSVSFTHTVPRGLGEYGVFKYSDGDYTTFPFGGSCAGLKVYVSSESFFITYI